MKKSALLALALTSAIATGFFAMSWLFATAETKAESGAATEFYLWAGTVLLGLAGIACTVVSLSGLFIMLEQANREKPT